MHPILFEVGGNGIHTYGALGALAFLLVAGIALYRGKQQGLSPERMTDLIFWTALASILGSRIVFGLQNPEAMETAWDWVNLRKGGLVFYGAMIVGLPVGSMLMKRLGLPFWATWDIFATGMPLGHGIARLGCFAAGCCYGRFYDGPFAVIFPDHPLVAAPANSPIHPVQLYEAFYLFGVAIVVNVFYNRKRFDGQVMLLYILLYAFGRTVIETFRGDVERGWFMESLLGQTLSWSQGMSFVLAAVCLAAFFLGGRRKDADKAEEPQS